jgi:hypothetical protein
VKFRFLFPRIALALLASIAVGRLPAATTPAAEKNAARSGGPRLQIAEPAHDFGRVVQGRNVRHDFKITNTGDAPLEIIDVKPACGCTTAGEWTRTLQPGETGTIPIQLNTAQFVTAVTKTIAVSTNDPTHPQTTLEIKAAVWTPVQISNSIVIFPAQTDPTQVISRSITIRNLVDGDLKVSDPHSDKAVFAPTLKETVPGKEFELTLTTVPPLPSGTQTARITMKSSNPDKPELSVQAVLTLLPPIQVVPAEITLRMAKVTAPEQRYFVLLNHRGFDLQVSDLKTDAAGVELTTTASPDKKQITVMLTFPAGFQADAPGKHFVRGRTNHPEMPTFEVPIVYTGNR